MGLWLRQESAVLEEVEIHSQSQLMQRASNPGSALGIQSCLLWRSPGFTERQAISAGVGELDQLGNVLREQALLFGQARHGSFLPGTRRVPRP